jgi:hypothetical protein
VVSTWTWCPSLSSSAVVSFSSPKTCTHSPKENLVIMRVERRSLRSEMRSKRKVALRPLERDEPQLIEDEQIHPPQARVQEGERPLVASFCEGAHQVARPEERHLEALLAASTPIEIATSVFPLPPVRR